MGWGLAPAENSSAVAAAAVAAVTGGGPQNAVSLYEKQRVLLFNVFLTIGPQNRDLDAILPGN